MKEITKWDGKPRWMWCWDDDEDYKCKRYVLCILTDEQKKEVDAEYSVCTYVLNYKHCAEIEEETTRLTNYELSQLLKCFGVEIHDCACDVISNAWSYLKHNINEKLPEGYEIRYQKGKWEEPTRETIMKWYYEENDTDIEHFVDFIGWNVSKE